LHSIRLKKSNKEMLAKLDEMRNENSILQNNLRDTEMEMNRLKENDGGNLNKFMDLSNRINDLERENRSLKTDIDYQKYIILKQLRPTNKL